MKILHLADLHLGKALHNASLIENGDQPFWIDRVIELIDREHPDAVVIAGDVYDRGVPPKEAVQLFSRFLTEAAGKRELPVFLIAGNHDGGERLEFAADLLADRNVHIAGSLKPELYHFTLSDDDGPVTFWLMPYVFPMKVRDVLQLEPEEARDYDTAVRSLLAAQEIDFSARNVLVAHQFVVNGEEKPQSSASESMVGGVGAIDYTAFDGFDYAALGHIHGAQSVGRESVRYAGAPLCYHFSEVGQKKSALMVTLGPKGTESICEEFELPVLHNMRCISGKFEDILRTERDAAGRNEYVSVEITDSEPILHAADTLQALFDEHGTKMLNLSFRPEGRGSLMHAAPDGTEAEKSMEELFAEFFAERMGEPLGERETQIIQALCTQVENHGDETPEELTDMVIRLALEQEG